MYLLLVPMLLISACKDDEEEIIAKNAEGGGEYLAISAFYNGSNRDAPTFTEIAQRSDRIQEPQDLDFHPTRENELWVINKGTENSGSSTLTITDADTPEQEEERRVDGNAWHFVVLGSAL